MKKRTIHKSDGTETRGFPQHSKRLGDSPSPVEGGDGGEQARQYGWQARTLPPPSKTMERV